VRWGAGVFARFIATAAVAGALLGGSCGGEKRQPPRVGQIEDELAPRSPGQGGLEFERWVTLELRDEPFPLNARLKHADGRVDSAVAVTMSSRDTTVVRVANGTFTPVSVGRTTVGVRAGDLSGLVFVTVFARIAGETLVLNQGEVRAWELGPGTYEISIQDVPETGRPSPLELVADIKCSTDARRPFTITCLVREPTRFVLRHTGVRPTPGGARAIFAIVQVP
jgi:hypothetical protein